jgi:hypothetical protein
MVHKRIMVGLLCTFFTLIFSQVFNSRGLDPDLDPNLLKKAFPDLFLWINVSNVPKSWYLAPRLCMSFLRTYFCKVMIRTYRKGGSGQNRPDPQHCYKEFILYINGFCLYCTLGEVDFWITISYSLQLMGKTILRLK